MKVMYTCDDNYVWLMGISMISLFENNKELDELIVYLLGENICCDSKEKLKKISNEYNRKIIFVDVPKLEIPTSLISGRWPISAFTRLFSAAFIPESIERVLYLDCDTIVEDSISKLESVDFGGKIAMGVKECIGEKYKRNIGLDVNDIYINAGVILFNMNALRKINVYEEIENYISNYEKLINYADQDILNGIFRGKIGELEMQYNVMTVCATYNYKELLQLRRPTNFYSEGEYNSAKKKPSIIHYTTNMLVIRPWYSNTNHLFAENFKKYMVISPWKDKLQDKMVFSSKEEKTIRVILKLPRRFALWLLGIIHAELKPTYIKMKARG